MKVIKSRIILCFCCLILVSFSKKSNAQQNQSRLIESITFKSNILKRTVNYSVYLPKDYQSSQKKYPVLFLLNGYGGDNKSWNKDFFIKKKIDSLISIYLLYPCVIIMPDGMNTYYINDVQNKRPYESFLHKEFFPKMDSVYRILPDKNFRAVGGMSMGGFGAVIHSIKYPDKFGTCIALGAAIRTDSMVKNTQPGLYEQFLSPVFGNQEPKLRITNHWKNNNPLYLVNKTNTPKLTGINWYIDCGMYDYLYNGNKAFHEMLMRNNIPHEYHMRIGEHNDRYWKISLIQGILFWNDQLKKAYREKNS